MNGEFFDDFVTVMAPQWGIDTDPSQWGPVKYQDYDKIRHIMKQIVREWTSEGRHERETGFNKVWEILESKYRQVEQRSKVKLLIPGAGLGRLNYEAVKRGFWCQGNEFSYHMLLMSNYILNFAYSSYAYSIFPYIHSSSNQSARKLQTRPVYFPDEHTSTILQEQQMTYPSIDFAELMSIASGSFTDLYGPNDLSLSQSYSNEPSAQQFRQQNESSLDCVITHFFIDTATNVIEYLKTIHHCLKPGGQWINYGPLLWHFEDQQEVHEIIHPDGTKHNAPTCGLEMSLDDLLQLSNKWFDLEVQESGIKSGYGADCKAMGGWSYNCEFWVMTKRPNTPSTL